MQRFAGDHEIDLPESWAYSDSASDLPMLRAVGNPVAVNPDPELARIAAQQGWRVMRFEKLGRRLAIGGATLAAAASGTLLASRRKQSPRGLRARAGLRAVEAGRRPPARLDCPDMAVEPGARRRTHEWLQEVYSKQAEREAPFETISGQEVRPLYTGEDLADTGSRARPRIPRRAPLHPRRVSVHVPGPAVDDAPVRRLRHRRGDERALPLPAGPRPDRPLDRVRHADPDGPRLRPRPQPGRGGRRGGGDRHPRRRDRPLPRHPAGPGDDLDDDQRPGGDPARLLRLRRRGAGHPAGGARRHDPDRHPEGVHRPKGVVLSDRAGDAAGHRHGRVVRRADAALAPDLDLRLPHPRGGLDGAAGARLHAQGRVHVRRVGARARARRRRLRAPPLVLLQRPHRLLRGDREVPRRAADLGARDARHLRRPARGVAADALPHADRGRLADGAAAAGQHRPDRDRGAGGGARAAPSRFTRTPSTRRWRCPRRRR